MRRHVALLIPGVLCLAALTGCASSGSKNIAGWQKSVEQYIHERGDDPAVLRDACLEDGRPGFVVIGGLDPRKSTDARGILLGHKTIDNRPWFIYLVGIVQREKVQEIRLAALSATPSGQRTWRIGPRDSKSLKLYRDWGWNEWKKVAAGAHGAPPPHYTNFPRPDDVFDLTLDGQRLIAKHTASGAIWIDDIRPPTAAQK